MAFESKTWTDEERNSMSYYNDSTLADLMKSKVRDIRNIPFFNRHISQDEFIPALKNLLRVAEIRFADTSYWPENFDATTVENDTWKLVTFLEELSEVISIEAKKAAAIEREKQDEAKKARSAAKAAAAQAARQKNNAKQKA